MYDTYLAPGFASGPTWVHQSIDHCREWCGHHMPDAAADCSYGIVAHTVSLIQHMGPQ